VKKSSPNSFVEAVYTLILNIKAAKKIKDQPSLNFKIIKEKCNLYKKFWRCIF